MFRRSGVDTSVQATGSSDLASQRDCRIKGLEESDRPDFVCSNARKFEAITGL